jgi:hypothetical protein
MASKINFRRVFIISGLISLAAICIISWIQTINDRSQMEDADFLAYYSAGRVAQLKGADQVYNLETQHQIEQAVIGRPIELNEIHPYIHPPIIIPLLAILVNENFIRSLLNWQLFMLFIFGIGMFILMRSFSTMPGFNKKLIFVEMLLFSPVLASVSAGQDTAILFSGVALLLIGYLNKQDMLAGVGLALTTVRPQITILLLIPFLINRRNVLLWFSIFATILGLLSLLIVGPEGILGFIKLLLLSSSGAGYHTAEYAMVNIIGVLYRGTWLDPQIIRIIGWISYLGSGLLLAAWGLRERKNSLIQIAMAIFLAIFTAPHLHYHDLALMLIPMVILMLRLHDKQLMSPGNIALLPLVFAWIIMLSNTVSVAVRFSFPSFLMLVMAIWILFPEKSMNLMRSIQFPRPKRNIQS